MAAKEREIINKILADMLENTRLFRSNSGMAWAGQTIKKGDFIVIKNPRPFHGMPEGFPDLIGWTSVTVTPDMVGQKIAVFIGIEVKATGKLSEAQAAMGALITRMGGIFKVMPS
jgi:hypothetical protein